MNNSIFMGVVIGLVSITVAVLSVMTAAVNASIVPSHPSGDSKFISGDIAVGHINEAQSVLQNGDIEAANNHLELAKQSL